MAIFEDGFESGDFTAWTGTTVSDTYGSLTVQDTTKHKGTYAANSTITSQAAWTNAFCYKTFTGVTTAYMRQYVYVSSFSTPNYARGFMGLVGSVVAVYVGLDGNSRYLRIKGEGLTETTSSTALSLNTWYCVEVKYVVHATNGEVRVWLDGVAVDDLTQTGKDTSAVSSVLQGRSGWWDGYSVAGTVFVDCVVVADAYIGPISSVSIPVMMHHYGHHINKIIRG